MSQVSQTAKLISSRGARWLLFYCGVAVAWASLYFMQVAASGYTAAFGQEFWASLCITDPGYSSLAFMWLLMAGAMMAPTAIPMLVTYDDLRHAGAGSAKEFWALIAGYLIVWAGFSFVAAWLQQLLFQAHLVNFNGQSTSPLLSAGLLGVAGAYQFSSFKNACLTACQSPLKIFMGSWKPGVAQVFTFGIREGLNCLGCCWALMLLAFIGGTMNIAFMALAMFLMLVEKLSDFDRFVTKPLGVALLAGAVLTPFI